MKWLLTGAGLDWEVVRLLARRGRLRKLLNYVTVSLQRRRGSSFLLGAPYHIYIDPSSRCTLGCPLCAVGSRNYPKPMRDMSWETFRRILDELGPTALVTELYVKGEPLMNPLLCDMIAYCKRFGTATVISTNLQDLPPGGEDRLVASDLDCLVASIDGATQESYARYRVRGDLRAALDGLRRLSEAKRRLGRRRPFLIWKFIVFRHNQDELDKARRLAEDLGVDRVIFMAPYMGSPGTKAGVEPPTDPRFGRYPANLGYDPRRREALDTRFHPEEDPDCNLPWVSTTFDPGGNVQTCCVPVDPAHDHGAAGGGFYWKVWNNRRYRESRRLARGARTASGSPNLCRDCAVAPAVNAVLYKPLLS